MEYKIKIPKIPNMGDLLNKEMLESVFNIKVHNVESKYDTNISVIGSHLGTLLYSNGFRTQLKQRIRKPFLSKDYYVWGTGFMNYNSHPDNSFLFRNVHICSLRGKLTKERVEKILKTRLNVPLGDGGLLADRWIGKSINKKYTIGIIPHYKEQDSQIINQLKNHYSNSIIINLRDKPMDVVRQIAECETILSSSLHGLIVADSFHIPNQHIMLYEYGERMKGDGFKFADYYSSYGLEDNPLRLYQHKDFPSIDEIVDNYLIGESDVEEKKNQISDAFPRFCR
jgi:hypothetical protein